MYVRIWLHVAATLTPAKGSLTQRTAGWVDPQSRYAASQKKRIHLSCLESSHDFLVGPARKLVSPQDKSTPRRYCSPSKATNIQYSLRIVTILPIYFRPIGTHQWFVEVYTEISLHLFLSHRISDSYFMLFFKSFRARHRMNQHIS